MSMIRTLAMLAGMFAAPVASPRAFAGKPADQPAAPAPAPADRPADKTADKTTVSDAEAQRYYAFIERLIAIVVATQDDCVKMAAGVNAHVDASQALLKEASQLRQQNKHLPAAVKEKIARKLKDELQPALIRKCTGDKPVQDAFRRIETR